MEPLNWTALKAISNSSFARLALLVPLLPFCIELLEVIFSPVYFAESAAKKAEELAGANSTYVSSMFSGLSDWATTNKSAVVSFYVGIVFFLIGKATLQFFVPKNSSKKELVEEMAKCLEFARLAKDAKNGRIFDFYNGRASDIHRIIDQGREIYLGQSDKDIRWVITCVFGFSIVLLVWPPIFKFFKIFFFDFLF